MEDNEMGDWGVGRGGGGGGRGVGANSPFIDRSKVRILLCDNDVKSATEVLELLCKCSYQVTSVRSARQVIDALNAEGADIDIILAEVDLPLKKGMKMLKYITRDKKLQRIPVIVMSAQDEFSIVIKCLRLGAADYLVKPLRTNELLNLWTHMWRRRRMLGLGEKNILHYDFDLMASDPSDANTNSTAMFSDDTDERSRKNTNLEMSVSIHQEDELNNPGLDPLDADSFKHQADMAEISSRQTGQFLSCPKKSELKIGESSAFFSYMKSSLFKASSQAACDENTGSSLMVDDRSKAWQDPGRVNNLGHEHDAEAQVNNSQGDELPSSASFRDTTSMERSCTPASLELLQSKSSDEGLSPLHMHPRNAAQFDIAGFSAHATYPCYMLGGVNEIMTSGDMYHLQDLQRYAALPHLNHPPHFPPHIPGMASFPFYPVGMCLQQGQMPTTHQLQSFGSSDSNGAKTSKVDRREAALIKFRQKRKERCFDKKIRYVNRKRLAEGRARVRGQFVRRANGMTADLNGKNRADLAGDEEEDDDDPASRDSSPEDDAA